MTAASLECSSMLRPGRVVTFIVAVLFTHAVEAINVIELDADSYHAASDGKKNLLVKFYEPNCYMCEEIEPEFAYAASKYDER